MKLLIFTMPDGTIAYSNGGGLKMNGQELAPSGELEMGEQQALDIILHPHEHQAQKDAHGQWQVQRKDPSQKGKPA